MFGSFSISGLLFWSVKYNIVVLNTSLVNLTYFSIAGALVIWKASIISHGETTLLLTNVE